MGLDKYSRIGYTYFSIIVILLGGINRDYFS